jgi:hypothetical protein
MSVSPSDRSLSVRTLGDLCTEIDALPARFTGEIRLSRSAGAPLGIVFVEARRVCWAAARGLARRLSDLIAERACMTPSAMEAHYRICKDEGIPLGEHLVGRGLLGAAALRTTLLQHTVESLEHVLVTTTASTFIPRPGGYSPRFTFTTAELILSSGRDERAAKELEHLFGGIGWGAAFVRGGASTPKLVALTGSHPEDASSLARLGRWGASLVDMADAASGGPAMVINSRGDRSTVALVSDGLLMIGEVGVHGAGRILNRRANRRHGRL